MKLHSEVILTEVPTNWLNKVSLPSTLKSAEVNFTDGSFNYTSKLDGDYWKVSTDYGELYRVLNLFNNDDNLHPFVGVGSAHPPNLHFMKNGHITGYVLSDIVNFYNSLIKDDSIFIKGANLSVTFENVWGNHVTKLEKRIAKGINNDDNLSRKEVADYIKYQAPIGLIDGLKSYFKKN